MADAIIFTRRALLARSAAALAGLIGAQRVAGAQDLLAPLPKVRVPEAKPAHTTIKAGLRRALTPFAKSPFPYDGLVPATGKPFLDVSVEGRIGRQSGRGTDIYFADETYSDRTVLIDIARGFSIAKPGIIVLYLHGNNSTLERDVIIRQRVPQQVAGAGLNSVLIAPQFAFDAADSSAGMFWKQGAFSAFLDEAATILARMAGAAKARRAFRQLPIVIIGYSGGYHPAAYILEHAPHENILGVVLLDALYGDVDKFGNWLRSRDAGFFVSAYTKSSLEKNVELQKILFDREVPLQPQLPPRLQPSDRVFIATSPPVDHANFVKQAWSPFPLRDLLLRIEGYARGPHK